MITFVYCWLCLLIVCCQSARTEIEEDGFNNDSPDFLPKVAIQRYKIGADIVIHCNNNHHINGNFTWEFKHCKNTHRGIHYEKKDIYRPSSDWKHLNTNTKRLKIRNATETNLGLYRCLYDDVILKVFVVDVSGPAKFVGPSPEVISLIASSNSTLLANAPLVIQCKVRSVMQTEIRWFKASDAQNCEVKYGDHCYRTIRNASSAYSPSNNIYISKLNIMTSGKADSGTYICLVLSVYGVGYKNITIKVDDVSDTEESTKFFWFLFLIPLCLLLVPVTIWLCFYRRNEKDHRGLNEHQKQLIKPVVEVDIVLNVDDVI